MGSWPRAAQSAPGQVSYTESGATSTSSRKSVSHQNHTLTTLAQASTAWNVNLIFQLINMINKNELPEPDCRRVQAAESQGTDPAAAEEMNQETLNLQTSSHQVLEVSILYLSTDSIFLPFPSPKNEPSFSKEQSRAQELL